MNDIESKSVVQINTCDIKVDDNEKYLGTYVSKVTEKTSYTSKKEDGEAGNISNSIVKFYDYGKNI